MTACPRPDKSRYATTQAAHRAARWLLPLLGCWLQPYRCPGCGWVHLTSAGAVPLPAEYRPAA